jgi:hypothetical protein
MTRENSGHYIDPLHPVQSRKRAALTHSGSSEIVDILILTSDCPVIDPDSKILKWGSRRVWPVSSGCLFLLEQVWPDKDPSLLKGPERRLIDYLIVLRFHLCGDVTNHHYRWRAAKFRHMLGAQGLWAGRDLYRATPAMTRGLAFCCLIRRTSPFSPLLRHTRRSG